MFASNVFIVSALALASTVQGAPLTKRIAQVIADSTAKWEAACVSFLLSFARLPFLSARLLVQFHSDEAKFISLSHGGRARERAAPCEKSCRLQPPHCLHSHPTSDPICLFDMFLVLHPTHTQACSFYRQLPAEDFNATRSLLPPSPRSWPPQGLASSKMQQTA